MSKVKNHRVEVEQSDGSKALLYVNDELTQHNKRLLWMTKTKAKESGWKFIWVKSGNIYARRNENSRFVIINNTSDLEIITSTNLPQSQL